MAQIYVGTVIEFPVRLLGGIVNNVKLNRGLRRIKILTTYILFLSVARGAFPPFFDTNPNRVCRVCTTC